jgi:hypothetical protein
MAMQGDRSRGRGPAAKPASWLRKQAKAEAIGWRSIAANEWGNGDDEPSTGPVRLRRMPNSYGKLCSTPRQPTADPVSVGA